MTIDLLNLANELKSTVSIGRRFQQFMTLSLKNDDLTEQLVKCLYSLNGCPLVRDSVNSKTRLCLHVQYQILLYSTLLNQTLIYELLVSLCLTTVDVQYKNIHEIRVSGSSSSNMNMKKSYCYYVSLC